MNSVLTRSEADAILGKYHPRAVIPAHYYVTGLMTAVSGLESANGWVNDQEKVIMRMFKYAAQGGTTGRYVERWRETSVSAHADAPGTLLALRF